VIKSQLNAILIFHETVERGLKVKPWRGKRKMKYEEKFVKKMKECGPHTKCAEWVAGNDTFLWSGLNQLQIKDKRHSHVNLCLRHSAQVGEVSDD
jgi:hypothetical protein